MARPDEASDLSPACDRPANPLAERGWSVVSWSSWGPFGR